MNIIEKFIKVLERHMDNLSIKKKFMQLYIFCVLLPLIITDSVVLYIVDSMESQRQYHEMANVANAVSYNISALVENAGEIAKSMYTNRRVNSFWKNNMRVTQIITRNIRIFSGLDIGKRAWHESDRLYHVYG